MTSSLSVLQRATPDALRTAPFPYLVIPNALPDDLCDALVDSYPDPAVMGVDPTRNNTRWSYRASTVLTNDAIPDLWKDFVRYHVSEAFYREVVALFSDGIRALYPSAFPTAEALLDRRVGIRKIDDFKRADLLLDAQIAGNTPVVEAGSVRTAHVDNPTKLFAGLFYLRRDTDDSRGGDLAVMRFRDPRASAVDRLSRYRDVYVDERYLETVETVRYEKNTLVMFVNSLDSLHGVSVRQPTGHDRIFLNLLGEVEAPLFRIPGKAERMVLGARRRLGALVGARVG